jgi:lipoprotein NlpI
MLLIVALLLLFIAPVSPATAQTPWNMDAQECFEETKPETFHPDKALPFCERALKSEELKTSRKNQGAIHYYIGTIYNSKRDYKRAMEEFKQATEGDPTLHEAHRYLGFTRFFLGDFENAQEDFADTLDLKRDDIFAMVWLYIARSRTGKTDAREVLGKVTKEVDSEVWPGPIVAMYLGRFTPQELVKMANDTDPKKRREKQCEANFYAGQQLLIEGKKAEAAKMFKAAVATNVTKFVEHEAARIELQRLSRGK